MYITNPDQFLRDLIARSFPGYKGKKIQIKETENVNTNSYWSGGSRSDYVAIRLDDLACIDLPENEYLNLAEHSARSSTPVPAGIVLVEHVIFRGKDLGIKIHVNPINATKLLGDVQNGPTLNDHERLVLRYTASLKSSYGGRSNYRFYEANRAKGITLEEWNAAKQLLIEKKLLNKAGAITPEGRNVYDAGKANQEFIPGMN